jgi:hypothetical protein
LWAASSVLSGSMQEPHPVEVQDVNVSKSISAGNFTWDWNEIISSKDLSEHKQYIFLSLLFVSLFLCGEL